MSSLIKDHLRKHALLI
uniref:Uncharacterized protein n=1 Tax=Arundo donax TaxID=35708 RepID=A0A0A9GKP0_ARUDO